MRKNDCKKIRGRRGMFIASAAFFIFHFSFFILPAIGQEGCYGVLDGDTLRIGNALVERTFVWNGGNLVTHSLTDKLSGRTLPNKAAGPDFHIPGEAKTERGIFETRTMPETAIRPACFEAEVSFSLGTLNVKRIYRIYENAPAIACETWLKGRVEVITDGQAENAADRKNIEFDEDMRSGVGAARLDRLSFDGFHWRTRIVEFADVTDWNNNLVFTTDIIPYRKNSYRGNLLFACNAQDDSGFFFLKEAPSSAVQLAYGGYDFTTEFGSFTVNGLGMTGRDILPGEWRRAYGCVTGVYTGSEYEALIALRAYQKNLRRLIPGRDEMVMMNTWGDRNQDSKVNEKFSLLELERAAVLGITHFQIDDGWQVGRSPNSAIAKGSFTNIHDNPDYWKPDPVKYPHGLAPVVERGRELGVEVCLWFNPSVQDDYADWEKDAAAMMSLYREYGIRTFKIDGLAIPTKQSEINLRRLFDRVSDETEGNAVFNLDATAGRRGGYHTFNEYGNIFLENRYTDWQNYYPYWTLRNLWQLSRYVPAEKLQTEFLNNRRNADKYAGDRFAPANYGFDYLFAVTMAGQPLAWFEGTGLAEDMLGVSEQINAYKKVQHDIHSGVILPVGDEPSGCSWTGFQSIIEDRGYFIFFREATPDNVGVVRTWLPEGIRVKLTPVLGHGKPSAQKTGSGGALKVSLPDPNSYVMYRYEL